MAVEEEKRVSTGVSGLDVIIPGGLPAGHMYLLEGDPGAGKTTLALQFLRAGAPHGEHGLYVTLSETETELRQICGSHGWSTDDFTICDLQATEESLQAESQYTLFHPAEIELSETTRTIMDAVETSKPTRVVVDSLSEMRMLARDPLRYRRQVLALKHYLTEKGCTVLLLDYRHPGEGEYPLESVAHGVIRLEQLAPEYGGERRRLRVQKIRGSRFTGGYHDFLIKTGGLQVYPRLVAKDHVDDAGSETISSGVPELDELLGGGLPVGTSTMFIGASGVGKSTLAAQFVRAVAKPRRGKVVVYSFDESPSTWIRRADRLGLDMSTLIDDGRVSLVQVDPAQLSPGEFAYVVRQAVEEEEAGLIVLDSLNGYLAAMPEERFLTLHVHELLAYLNRRNVSSILVMSQSGLLGGSVKSPVDLSYIADSVVLIRYFEAFGTVRRALSVVKKRTGVHQPSIRELKVGESGVRVGEELKDFAGILSGDPEYTGGRGPLLDQEE